MMKSCHNSRVYALSGPKGYWFSLSMGHTETIILSKNFLKSMSIKSQHTLMSWNLFLKEHYQFTPLNVCFIKNRSKHSSNTLLSLLQILWNRRYLHFHEIYILMNSNSYYGSTKVEKIPGDENASEKLKLRKTPSKKVFQTLEFFFFPLSNCKDISWSKWCSECK